MLVGSDGARRRLVVYEDPQCPFCRTFEDACGDLLRREIAAGAVAVEYRIRSFLGPESVRAAAALALAAEAGHFDQLRERVFAEQPPEHSDGFGPEDLLDLGRRAGLTDEAYTAGVRDGRHRDWVVAQEARFLELDPNGTPNAWLDGRPIDQDALYDREALGAALRS